MTSDTSSSVNEDAASATAEQLQVNLQVVSPSVGVTRPLLFSDLAATTTIKQLKEKIRQTLPLRPADDHQRLIHRGRALVRETDTLLDIFGEDAIRSSEQQTMHLVVRDLQSTQPSSNASTTTTSNTASSGHTPTAPDTQRPNPPVAHLGPQPMPGFPRRNPVQPGHGAVPPHGPGVTASPVVQNPEAAAAFQQQHQNMSSWLTHLQREAMTRAGQRNRATMGMRGTGEAAQGQEATSGRASPAIGRHYREQVGRDGQTYQIETIVRGPSQGPPGANGNGLSPIDVQNALRSADMTQATTTMTNAMHRSASGASLHSLYNRPLNQPGVTAPVLPRSDSQAPSGRATPDPAVRSVSGSSNSAAPGRSASQPRPGVDVYILSSPEGPRALLVNNGTSETYYSPRMQTQASDPRLRSFISPISTTPGTPLHSQQEQHRAGGQAEQQQQGQGQDQQAAQGQDAQGQQQQPQLANWDAVPDNPREQGLPPLLVQAWPHIWLVFRLCVFVWFFTSPYSSWSRWISVVGLAVAIFIYSIGALQHVGQLAWRPIAHHLENMLPRLEQPAREPARAAGNDGNRDPDPADLAARLIAQRQRENWVQAQIRRIERAGLLFLASIAPGVVEDHINRLEEEARNERQRIEAEAAEAERRRQEAEAGAAETAGEDSTAAEATGNDAQGATEPQPQQAHDGEANTGEEQTPPNLVAV